MARIYLLIILIVLQISIVFMDIPKCNTPQECYDQSKNLLNEDRYNRRNNKSDFEAFIDEQFNETKKEIANEIIQIESKWNITKEAYQKKLDDNLEQFKTEYEIIKPLFDVLKQKIENQEVLNEKRNHMYKEAIIYDDIINSLEKGIISKVGNPSSWDENTYRSNNPWKGKTMLRIGVDFQNKGNGIQTIIPSGYNVLWLRINNNEWGNFLITYADGDLENVGIFSCGFRRLNEISPEGGAPDAYSGEHIWTPIPVYRSGKIYIQSAKSSTAWLSGIAFGKNLWNHAKNSAVAYLWAVNGGNPTGWDENWNWNNDQKSFFKPREISTIIVPVVNSGKDKILYIIEHNSNWLGIMHTSVKVNGVYVERFRTSYSNPFATHFNSKIYERYIATVVPYYLIKSNFITVEIDMKNQDATINFREIGTHDLE